MLNHCASVRTSADAENFEIDERFVIRKRSRPLKPVAQHWLKIM